MSSAFLHFEEASGRESRCAQRQAGSETPGPDPTGSVSLVEVVWTWMR